MEHDIVQVEVLSQDLGRLGRELRTGGSKEGLGKKKREWRAAWSSQSVILFAAIKKSEAFWVQSGISRQMLSYVHQTEPAKSSSQPLKWQCLQLKNREVALEILALKAISATVMCEELCTSITVVYELYK